MEKRSKKGKALAETPASYHTFKSCIVTDSFRLAKELTRQLGSENVKVKGSLADSIEEKECGLYIVDTKVGDMSLWPAPLLLQPGAGLKSWLFLLANPADALSLGATPADSAFFERHADNLEKLVSHVRNRIDPQSRTRLARVQYIQKARTFIVRLQNGRTYPLRLDDLPEADSSAAVHWNVGRGRHDFKVVQESGNEFEVPWDEVLYHCEPEYEYYKGRQSQDPDPNRAMRIGNRVRQWRTKRGITITELAERAGMKRPNLSRLEHGQHVPSLETLERVAEALSVPVADLVAASAG